MRNRRAVPVVSAAGFRGASEREVREADLFWAELTGEPVRWTSRQARRGAIARAVRARADAFEELLGGDAAWSGEDAPETLAEQAVAGATASPCDVASGAETLDRFALDSSALTAAHLTAIRRIAGCIAAIQATPRKVRELRLVGFTDPSGPADHNVRLGRKRAEAVRGALVRALNALAPGAAAAITFQVDSVGEARQIAGGAAANRRVQVSVPLSVTGLAVHPSDPDTHAIPSNLGAAGLAHFVCVKGTGDVVLEALLSPAVPGDARGRLTWSGPAGNPVTSPAVGTEGRTGRLSSSTQGKFPISIGLDGAAARSAVVWVVWSTIQVTATRNPTATATAVTTGDGTEGLGLAISAGIDHTFTIQPPEIVSDADRPALNGPRTAAVPGAAQTHVISGRTLAGGAGDPLAASSRWDVSRQIRVRILNPCLYPVARLSAVAGHLWNGQPTASTVPEDYPATDTIGNDDTHAGDENDVPYPGGAVTSTDDPTMIMRDDTGADGDTFERRYQFREFLRLDLGTAWYRASDFSAWRFHGRFRRAAGAWTDDGSTFARDNAGF